MTIQLAHPVEHDGVKYDSVTIREPEVGDSEAIEREMGGVEEMNKANITSALMMAERLSGVPIEALRKLKLKDWNKVSGKVADFLA